MKLTKEQAIAEHRKMWLWISRHIMKDYLANKTVREIYFYKCDYLNKVYPNEMITNKCFCCDYVEQSGIDCYKDCPLYWNNKHTEYTCSEHFGYYNIIARISTMCHNFCTFKEAKKMAIMAYKIAMLEERGLKNV
jgi:hypothetical protein